jgi:hypothetical protein
MHARPLRVFARLKKQHGGLKESHIMRKWSATNVKLFCLFDAQVIAFSMICALER